MSSLVYLPWNDLKEDPSGQYYHCFCHYHLICYLPRTLTYNKSIVICNLSTLYGVHSHSDGTCLIPDYHAAVDILFL